MPSSSNVDERVVQMRMDNEQFEKGAERTIGTLGRLKKSMEFEKTKVGGLDFSPLEQSVEKIGDKISMTFSAKKRVIENMIDGVVNTFTRAVNSLDNIGPGYQKYESQIEAVQKLMIATGESMDNVQKMSDKILAFTDETSYEYTSMLSTLSQFSTAGVGLEDAQNTIIGMAVAAGQAGVSASQASHAFMGFQKAMSQGYMGSNQWDWIKTAGMNTIELQQALIDAAVAEGKLRDAGNGIYYAQQETAKGIKEIEVTVENMGNTFASKWLSKEAMIKGMSNYAKAFNQIYEIAEREGIAIWQVIDDNSPYLDQLDQYSLAAFKAGQETKTWTDAVNALKSTISSGWMKSFELIIGNYEQATGFFTDIIEPLYTLFTGAGSRRNSFLEAAFGSSGEAEQAEKAIKGATVNWDRLSKKLKATEHTTDELEDAFKKVAESDDQVRELTKEYGSLEEAIKDGAVSGDQLKQILNEINGITTETSEAVEDSAASYQQYLETAWAVLSGDYGNGEDRRKALEELGMDYEMIQWLAGNLANGMTMDTLTLDWIAQVAPNYYQEFIEILGQTGSAAEAAGKEFIDLADVVEEAAVVSETAGLSGREIWQNSVTNILTGVADTFTAIGDAFDEVFGDAKTRGEGFRGWLNRIYEATKHFKISEDIIASLKDTFVDIFTSIKAHGEPVLKFLKDFIKDGFASIPKAFKALRKTGKFVIEIFGDLFGWIRKLFSGRFELPENLQNSESLLAIIARWLLDIFNRTREFMNTAFTGGGLWTALDKGLDKLEEFRDKLKGGQGLGSIIKEAFGSLFNFGEGEEPKGIFGIFSRLFGSFAKDSEDLSGNLLTIEDSMGGFSDSVRGLSTAMTGMTNVLEPVSNLLFGDPGELEKKITDLWGSVKRVFVTEYGKINWDTLLDIGKLGLIGLLFTKTKSFFGTLTGTLKQGNNKPGTIRGLIASLQGVADAIKSPFNAMSKAIANSEKADRYLKIAAAIGILAWSIAKLTTVDEQKFFNVAVTLGMLMLIMAKMAKSMDGFQLFSNNVKTISKNNQSSSSVLEHLGESLKNFLSLDLSNFQGKLKINVFSQVAQTLIGASVLLVAIVHSLMKLKDITQPGELEKLYPAFVVIGSILVAMTALVGALALVTSKSKYLGKAGGVMLAMAITLFAIVEMIKSFAKMTDEGINYKAMIVGAASIVGALIGIALVMWAASTVANGNWVESTKAGAILATAAVLLSIGILVRSLVKSIDMASKVENIGQGIGIVVGILVAIIGILLLMRWIVKDPMVNGSKMVGVAASLLVLAVAIAALAIPVGILSAMNPAGMLAAALALSILVFAAAGAMAILANVPVKKLLVVAAVMGVVAVVLGLLMAAAAAFTSTMIGIVTGVPWENLQERVQAFDAVLRPELGLLLGLGAAAMMFGIGCAGAALAAGVFGLSFLAIAAGIYIVAAALPKLIDGIIYFMQQLQEHGWEIVKFVALVITAILAVMVARKLEIAKTVVSIVATVAEALKDGVLIGKVLSVIALFADKALAMLILLAPILSEKLVALLTNLIWSVADALNARSGELIAAFEALIGTLFTIGIKALANLSGDILGFLGDFIAEIIRAVAPRIGGGVADFIEKHLGSEAFEESAQVVSDAADRALERSFMNNPAHPRIEAEATASLTITDTELAFRPGDSANIEFDGTVPVNVSSSQVDMNTDSSAIAVSETELIIEDLTKELSGDGETPGIPGALTDGYSLAAENVDPEAMVAPIIEQIGGEEALKMFTGGGEGGAEAYVGGMDSFLNGDYTSGIMNFDGNQIFDMIGGSFMASSDKNTPSLAENLVNGIHKWIVENGGSVLQRAGAFMYGSVQTGVENAGVIRSPSKAMAKEGRWMVLGLAKGLMDNANIAYGAGSDTATGLIDEFRQTMEKVALIASDDFDISPTITPVVDLSNAQAAAGAMDGLFVDPSRRYVSEMISRSSGINAATSVSSSARSSQYNDAVIGEFRSLSSRLDELGAKIENMQIVLDTGVLVGSTSSRMDNQLGRIAARRERAR